MELVYGELRRLASSYLRRPGKREPLQATELVHEAFIKLVKHDKRDWRSRSHFYAVAATAMRQILVDRARQRLSAKGGAGAVALPLTDAPLVYIDNDSDIVAVDDALTALSRGRPERARLVELRFFTGLTMAEAAEAMGVSQRSLEREWTITKAWMRRELGK